MPGGSTDARAAVSSQGAFTGKFDSDMTDCRLIGGKTKLQQFDLFQQALSNAMVKYCYNVPEDVQALIIKMKEVDMDELNMPDNSLLSDLKGDLHKSNYKDDMQRWKKRMGYYKSNKNSMCSVVLGQCDATMQVKLQVTENWEANKTDLLFVFKTAQAASIGVQENYSMHSMGREAFRSLANCFQNSDTALVFKQKFLACKKKINKC